MCAFKGVWVMVWASGGRKGSGVGVSAGRQAGRHASLPVNWSHGQGAVRQEGARGTALVHEVRLSMARHVKEVRKQRVAVAQ